LITTSEFTDEALEWGKDKPIMFLNGRDLVERQVDQERKPTSSGKTSEGKKRKAPDIPTETNGTRKRPGKINLRRLIKKQET
jgi:hypothetical protein